MNSNSQALIKFREYLLGPTRFMTLLSCFELGLIESLKAHPQGKMNAEQLGERVGITAHKVEQMMSLLVKEGLVAHSHRSGEYTLDGIGSLTDDDLTRVLNWMHMVKDVCLRQLYYLSASVRNGSTEGLKEIYGFDGTFYEAITHHPDLGRSWGKVIDEVASRVDPWFHGNLTLERNAKVLDLAGNTGMGAILACQHHRGLGIHVTCFDFPEKESEAIANFRRHGTEENCSFVGGNALEEIPGGFDVVLVKHFLELFDKEKACRALRNAHTALNPGGKIYIFSPMYGENFKGSYMVDFFPAYFLGCVTGEGGLQKMSTYQEWLEECGFRVTGTLSEDMNSLPQDVILAHGMICAVKDEPSS
ncbi:methyltransferase [Streptomyces sp. NPDC127068]|uniref:methyltransferase n=1 Tax=Streptomyces sp. NPDC127068 TaxID=3347127 RepID=UPI003665C73D